MHDFVPYLITNINVTNVDPFEEAVISLSSAFWRSKSFIYFIECIVNILIEILLLEKFSPSYKNY